MRGENLPLRASLNLRMTREMWEYFILLQPFPILSLLKKENEPPVLFEFSPEQLEKTQRKQAEKVQRKQLTRKRGGRNANVGAPPIVLPRAKRALESIMEEDNSDPDSQSSSGTNSVSSDETGRLTNIQLKRYRLEQVEEEEEKEN